MTIITVHSLLQCTKPLYCCFLTTIALPHSQCLSTVQCLATAHGEQWQQSTEEHQHGSCQLLDKHQLRLLALRVAASQSAVRVTVVKCTTSVLLLQLRKARSFVAVVCLSPLEPLMSLHSLFCSKHPMTLSLSDQQRTVMRSVIWLTDCTDVISLCYHSSSFCKLNLLCVLCGVHSQQSALAGRSGGQQSQWCTLVHPHAVQYIVKLIKSRAHHWGRVIGNGAQMALQLLN